MLPTIHQGTQVDESYEYHDHTWVLLCVCRWFGTQLFYTKWSSVVPRNPKCITGHGVQTTREAHSSFSAASSLTRYVII